MTASRSHLAGLELARKALNHWPVTGLAAAKLKLDQLIAEAQSAPEPVQGEAVRVVGCLLEADPGDRHNDTIIVRTHHAEGRRVASRTAVNLMTVAQHNRIMAAAKPDAELVRNADE